MNEKTTSNAGSKNVEFNAVLGWLAALSVSIASWASLAS
jgi:hypothetical protein